MITQIKCPRCGKVGSVVVDRKMPQYVVVEWSDGTRDTCVRAEDATRGDFGCGYDEAAS